MCIADLIFGFQSNYTVNETDRAVEICGEVKFPGNDVPILTEIDLGVNTIAGTAGYETNQYTYTIIISSYYTMVVHLKCIKAILSFQ